MKESFYFIYLIYFFLFNTSIISRAQENGIKFENGLSWQQIKDKAAVENKLIFMDCYATWCGPCKFMDKSIFTLKDVGEYFNTHFINVTVQMDKTSDDNFTVRNWYQDAAEIKKNYKISAYPTYLFFSSSGQPLHQLVGASETRDEFLAKVNDALEQNKQYFNLIEKWKNYTNDSAFLLRTIIAAKNAGDDAHACEIAGYYIDCLKDPITESNIQLFNSLIISEKDKVFQFYLQYSTFIDTLKKSNDMVEEKLGRIIFKNEIIPILSKKRASFDWPAISANTQNKYPSMNKQAFANILDIWFQSFVGHEISLEIGKNAIQANYWKDISQSLKIKYPGYDCGQILIVQKVQYYGNNKSWDLCAEAALSLISQYGRQLGDKGINDICWNCIFLHARDREILTNAVKQMEKVVKSTPEDCADIDTYANLLYKIGQRQAAIEWENKAISICQKNNWDDQDFKNNLNKMEEGKATWLDETLPS